MREEKVIVSHRIEKEHSLANLVQIACRFDSRIQIRCDEKTLNAKSIIGMMSLNPQAGAELTVTAEGADESQAIQEIIDFLR